MRYYIECVREDEGQSVSVYLGDAGKRFILWPFPSDLSRLDDAEPRATLGTDQLKFANELRGTPGGGGLLYGYPTYIEVKQTARYAVPLFTWPIEYELNDRELWLQASTEWPQMNPDYLRKLAFTAEEQREILDSLGLLDTTDDPPDGLIFELLKRMEEMGLLQNVLEPLDPEKLSNPCLITGVKAQATINCAALFAAERPTYTAGVIRDLHDMVQDAPGWFTTALAPMLGEREDPSEEGQTAVEAVPLNEEQREAVRKAINSPLTAVTGPPGTGKSQIVVSMIADAYIRGKRVLFTSKNHKAVDVVEARVSDLAANPLMIRTGSRAGGRDFRHELIQRLAAMLALQPTQDDRLKYDELKMRYEELQAREHDLWAELQPIRLAHERLLSLDKARARLERGYSPHEWERLQKTSGVPNSERLKTALQLVDKQSSGSGGLLGRFSRRLSASGSRKRIQNIAAESMIDCPALDPCPTEDESFQVWRTWLARALSVAEALDATAKYRNGVAKLHELRSRDEIARQLRRVRADVTDTGAQLVALYARLAPDRLEPADRRAIGNFRTLLEQLAGDQLSGRAYRNLRRNVAQLFPVVSRHIPAWCVTNLSARSSLPLEPNLFDLLIIDEASQCDIASALPLLYRSKRAVVIGDPQQLRHITNIERRRDQQLQAAHHLGANDQIFTYSMNSLFDLSISLGTLVKPIQLQDHHRSHSHIVGFSNRQWYQNALRIWTDYRRLKAPPDGRYGIRWTNISGTATRPLDGSVFIMSEVEAVVERVVDLLMNQRFDGTVGIVTPFRPQRNMILDRVAQRVPADVRDRAQLIAETAHRFQGDERDIIILSPCVSWDMPDSSRNFLRNTGNLFNVAITRALIAACRRQPRRLYLLRNPPHPGVRLILR